METYVEKNKGVKIPNDKKLSLIYNSKVLKLYGPWHFDEDTHAFNFQEQLEHSRLSFSYLISVESENYLIHPDDLKYVSDKTAELQEGKSVSYNFRVVSIGNQIKSIHGFGSLLQDPEEILQTVSDSSPLAIQVLKAVRNQQGKIVHFENVIRNEKAKEYLAGIEINGEISKGYFSLFVDVIEHGKELEQEILIENSTHQELACRKILKLQDCVMVTWENISARKSAELILNEINEVCFELDKEFRFIYANRRALEFWNRTSSEIMGKVIWDVFPEDWKVCISDILIKSIVERKQILSEVWCIVEQKWLLINANPSPLGLIVLHFEITELVKAREKIKANEVFVKEAEAVGNIGSYEIDVKTNSLRFSDGMYRLLGFEPDAVIPTLDLIDAMSNSADALEVRRILGEAINRKERYKYLRRIYISTGEMRYIFSNGKVLCDNEGNAVKVIGIARDITTEHVAEEKVKENKELLQAIFDSTSNGITVLKCIYNDTHELADFEYILINRRAREANMVTGDEHILFSHLHTGVEKIGLFEMLKHVVETGEPRGMEAKYPAGTENWYQFRARKLMHDRVVYTFENITERKKASLELIRNQELLQKSLDALPQLVWMFDVKGEVNVFNERWYSYTGLTREQSTGYHYIKNQVVHPSQIEEVMHKWQQCLEAGTPYVGETLIRNKRGEYRWHLDLVMPIKDEHEQVFMWVGTLTDVHETYKNLEYRYLHPVVLHI